MAAVMSFPSPLRIYNRDFFFFFFPLFTQDRNYGSRTLSWQEDLMLGKMEEALIKGEEAPPSTKGKARWPGWV